MNRKKIEYSIRSANEKVNRKQKLNTVADEFLSSRLNDDMQTHIKYLLEKKDIRYSYSDVKHTIADLIKIFYVRLNDAIYNDYDESDFKYSKTKFIHDRDARLLYNMIILIFTEFPNKLFTIKKFKFSKVNKYFIYEIHIKNTRETKYVVFDYSEHYDTHKLFLYTCNTIEELKETIKDNFQLSSLTFSKSRSTSR